MTSRAWRTISAGLMERAGADVELLVLACVDVDSGHGWSGRVSLYAGS